MRKLIEYDHLSIDGRMSGDAWWAGQMKVVPNDNHFAYQLQLLSSAVGLVLGRVTYENFAGTWPTMTGDVADKINSLPKHVASTTLTETTWNAKVLAGDAVDAVAQLKESGDAVRHPHYRHGPDKSDRTRQWHSGADLYAESVAGHQDVGGLGRFDLLNLGGSSADRRREST
jgi:hypothetical protein